MGRQSLKSRRSGRSPRPAAGAPDKISKVFHEGKAGTLHSGGPNGPLVEHGSKQEIAIALSEQRKANRGGYRKRK